MKNSIKNLFLIYTTIPRQYLLLTVCVFIPLIILFLKNNQFYPIPVWSLFSDAVSLDTTSRTYYILSGVTTKGEIIEIPAIKITDTLAGRNHTMVYYTVKNRSLKIKSPHPNNVRLLVQRESENKNLYLGERIPNLLKSWGESYNNHLGIKTKYKLKSIILKQYKWPGKSYTNYKIPGQQWEVKL